MDQWLRKNREAILGDWLEATIQSYPVETAQFLRRGNDPFSNPVAFHAAESLGRLFDGLVSNADGDEMAAALDEMLRVRAVQEFSPAQAVAFIFEVKPVIEKRVDSAVSASEVLSFHGKIDRLALLAFDVYARCREQLYQVRLNDALGRPSPAMRRMACSASACADCDSEARN